MKTDAKLSDQRPPSSAPHRSVRQLWMDEARRRRDEVRRGAVKTISSGKALSRIRRALSKTTAE